MNLVASTITSTRAVTAAPSAFTARDRCILRRTEVEIATGNRLVQCRTMPAWLRVKETNTPMMYSWINLVVLASNATISATDAKDKIMIPLLKTSRSPRRANCRGR